MSLTDVGFKKARCEAIDRACHGQTTEKISIIFRRAKVKKEWQRRVSRLPSMKMKKEMTGASASPGLALLLQWLNQV
eukprot:4194976-Amphidinium_carterae.3